MSPSGSTQKPRINGPARKADPSSFGPFLFDRVLPILLLVYALWCASALCYNASRQTVSFDGAMNLQTANSLAQGEGYRRTYQDANLFPYEVETNAPFIFPAALAFQALGMSLFSAQLTGVVYFLAFLVLLAWLILRQAREREIRGALPAALALAAIVGTPKLQALGFNGYGEIPAITWVIAALLGLSPSQRQPWGRIALAGLALGFAVSTKTVMLIMLPAVILGNTTFQFLQPRPWTVSLRTSFGHAVLILVAVLIAQIPFEMYRLNALGGWTAYTDWWSHELSDISLQAGVREGYHDHPGFFSKGLKHFGILANALGAHPAVLTLLFLSQAAILLGLIAHVRRTPLPVQFWVLLFATLAYFFWWLFITPTQKAWLRRIFDGLLLLQILTFFSFTLLSNPNTVPRPRTRKRHILAAAMLTATLLIFCIHSPFRMPAPRDGLAPVTRETLAAAEFIRQLPAKAAVFGSDWYSAPTVSLYAERRVYDLTKWINADLLSLASVYLVEDHYTASVNRYEDLKKRDLLELATPKASWVRVYRLRTEDFYGNRVPSTVEGLRAGYDFSGPVPPDSFGIYKDGGYEGKWTKADFSFFLLPEENADTLTLHVRTRPFEQYRYPAPMNIQVRINGTHVADFEINNPGSQNLKTTVPPGLMARQTPVEVRVTVDNILEMRKHSRQLSIILHEARLHEHSLPGSP